MAEELPGVLANSLAKNTTEGYAYGFQRWKIAILSIKMSESKLFFRLTQATNTYKHISRNIWVTLTASRKLAHDRVF